MRGRKSGYNCGRIYNSKITFWQVLSYGKGAPELLEMRTESYCHLLAGLQQPWDPEQGIQPG